MFTNKFVQKVVVFSVIFSLVGTVATFYHLPAYAQAPPTSASTSTNVFLRGYTNYLTGHYGNILTRSVTNITDLQGATSEGWLVYFVWKQGSGNNSQIYLVYSQDGGRSYSKPSNLSTLSNSSGGVNNPHIGAFADDVYVTWEQEVKPGNNDVFLINSTNGGVSFGNALNVSNNPQNSVSSSLVVDKETGKVLVSWIDKAVGASSDDDVGVYCGRC